MKIALITDIHFGAREASLVVLDHQKRFYEDVFFPFLRATGIDTIILLGDTFDKRKYTNNFIIEQSKKIFFDELANLKIQTYIIIGNHDCAFKNTLFPNTPDLLLGEYDNIYTISHPLVMEIHGTPIAMIPWIVNENYDDAYDVIKNSKADVCMGHFEIEGFQMYRGVESHGGLKMSMFDRYDMVFSGHYHHRSSKGNITYLGTPYEMTWQDYADPKGFHVFDLETRELTFIASGLTMYKKIEYNDANPVVIDPYSVKDCYVKVIVVTKTDFYRFDQFINSLEQYAIEVKIIEDIGDFSSGEVSDNISLEDTQTVLEHYIDSVQTDIDKGKLKTYIQSLFTEAVNLDV